MWKYLLGRSNWEATILIFVKVKRTCVKNLSVWCLNVKQTPRPLEDNRKIWLALSRSHFLFIYNCSVSMWTNPKIIIFCDITFACAIFSSLWPDPNIHLHCAKGFVKPMRKNINSYRHRCVLVWTSPNACVVFLETVKDLIRFLKREDESCDIRRQLGHAQILQNDLIPILKTYKDDRILWETVIRLG